MRLVREPGTVKRREQPVPGSIAGEDTAGSVPPVRRGRQAHDHDPGGGSPNPGSGFAQ